MLDRLLGIREDLMIDEALRFQKALLHCFLPHLHLDHKLHDLDKLSDAFPMTPFGSLMTYAEVVGHTEFVRALLDATLDLYHEAHEWLVIFYSVALLLDKASEFIAEYLNGPSDHGNFIWKVILELEVEMKEQIADNFPVTPFNIIDCQSTRLIFHHIYRDSLFQISFLKTYLERRHLLL
jgi:hypothetical protein